MYRILLFVVLLSPTMVITARADAPASLRDALTGIRQLGPKGEGHAEAMAAWKQIASADAAYLPEILAAMSKDHVLANNWLRAAVESIVDRELAHDRTLPIDSLRAFLEKTDNAARGREIAFDLVTRFNESARDELLSGMLSDPSLELRRLALANVIAAADKQWSAGDRQLAVTAFRLALKHARDTDQIDAIAQKLRDSGEQVDLPLHFGFIMQWHLVAPFDNTNTSGFDQEYPPEKGVDVNTSYVGKDGQRIHWVAHTTKDDYGMVDLNKALDKHKGAAAYAYAEFISPSDRAADVRLGCINANKIWVNGEFVTANHVYHAGRGIDQYMAQTRLKAGKNQILLKICQNEQTEDWAQDWQFQFRVCDELGTAILSVDRVAAEAR